jgi:RimJ/RimL family protein N-acetyltransferase
VETMETEQLVLRPFRMEDLEQAHRVLDLHPDVWRFDPGYQRTLEERRQILTERLAQQESALGRAGLTCLAVEVRASGLLIGYSGLQAYLNTEPIPPDTGPYNSLEVEYFYKLGREFWGSGYAAEAGRAHLDFAFRKLKLRRIATGTHRENTRSISLLRRLGMTVHPDPADPDGMIGLLYNPYL